jgi:hypothetical protein
MMRERYKQRPKRNKENAAHRNQSRPIASRSFFSVQFSATIRSTARKMSMQPRRRFNHPGRHSITLHRAP